MWKFVVAPLLGGVIGYITNDIAIKMLFHPHRAYYIGKWHVPFTPGLIPSQKKRIAHSIGTVISGRLLDPETIRNVVLSKATIAKIEATVQQWMLKATLEERTPRQVLNNYTSDNKIASTVETISKEGSAFLMNRLNEMHVGAYVTDQIVKSVTSRVNILSFGSNILNGAKALLATAIDEIIESNCPELIETLIRSSGNELLDKPICELVESQKDRIPEISKRIVQLYTSLLEDNLENVLRMAKIDAIVENKVLSFNAVELEKLIFGLMKKELKAIVYLGAILGFFMGFINLLF